MFCTLPIELLSDILFSDEEIDPSTMIHKLTLVNKETRRKLLDAEAYFCRQILAKRYDIDVYISEPVKLFTSMNASAGCKTFFQSAQIFPHLDALMN